MTDYIHVVVVDGEPVAAFYERMVSLEKLYLKLVDEGKAPKVVRVPLHARKGAITSCVTTGE